MSQNQREGIPTNPFENMRKFDSLPAPIRRVIAHAPFDYNVNEFVKSWNKHKSSMSVAEFRAFLIDWLCEDLQTSAANTYGPDHPDAQRLRLVRRAA